MIYHCLSSLEDRDICEPERLSIVQVELVSMCRPCTCMVVIHANKKGFWLRQLNTLAAIDADIQQLLMEDLRRQVEYLVCILRLYNIYIMYIY
jgi:hypothetical protein